MHNGVLKRPVSLVWGHVVAAAPLRYPAEGRGKGRSQRCHESPETQKVFAAPRPGYVIVVGILSSNFTRSLSQVTLATVLTVV